MMTFKLQLKILYAAHEGHLDAVAILLENDADLTIFSSDKWQPIHIAAFAGKEKILNKLVEHGADINSITVQNDIWDVVRCGA